MGRHDKPTTEPENFFLTGRTIREIRQSVGAQPGCLHTQDTNRQADLSMIKAAEKMYKNLLEKVNEALKNTMSQQSEDPERPDTTAARRFSCRCHAR